MHKIMKCRIAGLIVFLTCGAAVPFCAAQSGTFSSIFQLDSTGAYLGVQMKDVTAANMSQYKLNSERGVIVESVVTGSPAEAANLQKGDVILEFGGYPVWSTLQISRLVQETPVGRKVELVVSRDGKRVNLTAKLETRERSRAENRMGPFPGYSFGPDMRTFRFPDVRPNEPIASRPRLGLTLQPLTEQLGEFLGVPGKKGALVASVASGSPSAGKLKSGDVIIAADGKDIKDPEDLTRIVRNMEEGALKLTIIRDKKEVTAIIDLPTEAGQKGYKL